MERSALSPNTAQVRKRKRNQLNLQHEMNLIGAELHRLRTRTGHTIQAAANATTIPRHRLARMEQGIYRNFGLTDLYRLAELYGVSPLDILSATPDTPPPDQAAVATAMPGP